MKPIGYAFQTDFYERNIKGQTQSPTDNADIARLRTGVGAGIPVYVWKELPEPYRVFNSYEDMQKAIAQFGESQA